MKSKNFGLRGLLTALMLCFMLSAVAQVSVKGIVQDKSGEPLIGATVQEKGNTANGTATGIDGDFALKVKSTKSVLIVSYVGMKSQEVALNGRTDLTVTLEDDSELLDEVVVVGYGTMKKSDLAGASTSLGENAIKGSVITNIDQSFQGRASGVSAVTTSGAPGSSSSIRVRGQATINANAEPLYVIDGVIVQSAGGSSGHQLGLGDALGNGDVTSVSPLSTINPSDIVSMEILKDASATAIYGAQGANGVVLITTKRGKAGEAKFTYDGMVAWQRQNERLDIMNLREYAEYFNDFVADGQAKSDPYLSDPSLLGKGTNWQDAIFRTALQHQHQVGVQGGTEKVQYYISGSFMDQEGTIIGSDFSRYSFRVNLDSQLKSWLKVGLSANYANTDENLKLADSESGIVNYSLTTNPDIPIYNIDGSYATIVREGQTNPNPVAIAMLDEIKLGRQKLNGNFFLEIQPVKQLVWHSEFGYDINWVKAQTYKPVIDLGSWKRDENSAAMSRSKYTFWQVKNYLTWSDKISLLNYSIMLGQECWESKYEDTRISNTRLPNDLVHNPYLGTGTQAFTNGYGSSAMASFFTRETLNWDGRYMLTYTYRYDGSSNFGPNNRWAGFHSVAGAWRFSNEKFFAGISDWFNNGKLRLGWGQTGNAGNQGYLWGSPLSSRIMTGLGVSYRPTQIANPNIKWESQEQWNIGLDLSFLNNRIDLILDLYTKESKDMLMQQQLPTYMGTNGNESSQLGAPWGNYGDIRNQGLEITLNARPVETKDFSWGSDFVISFNRNKLVKIDGSDASVIMGYGQWSDEVARSVVGKSLYNFFGYVTDGVYRDLEDIQNSPKPAAYPTNGVFNRNQTVWPGDIKFKDISGPEGRPDGIIDAYDRTDIGSPMPKFTFGWTNTFRYKDFDLSIFLNGSYGNKVMNYMSKNLTKMTSSWGNQLAVVNDRAKLVPIDPTKVYPDGQYWYDDITNVRVENYKTKIPRLTTGNPNANDRISDRYIEDGSYIRIKNITLGYTFPSRLIRKMRLENLRVYCNLQNLHTFTKYKGYDPEIGASSSSANVYGLDNGRYPSPTVYSFGLNVSF